MSVNLEEIFKKSANVMAKVEGIPIKTSQTTKNMIPENVEQSIDIEKVKNSKIPQSIIESFINNPIDTNIMGPRESSKIESAINNITMDFESDEKEMPTQEELIQRRLASISNKTNNPNTQNQTIPVIPNVQTIDYGYIEYLLNKVLDEKLSKLKNTDNHEGLEFKTFNTKDGIKYQGYVKKV